MSLWNKNYVNSLHEDFKVLTADLPDRLDAITDGRVVPEVEDLSLGGARHVRGAVLFFDIRGFTNRTGSPDTESLKLTLYMINSLIPTIMKIVHEHGGYIEKNTGDGIMAVIGAEAGIDDAEASRKALEIAMRIFYVMEHVVNPHLVEKGIDPVQARMGIDLGPLLLARIGVPKGSASQDRSFLTAVGPAANLASKLQGLCDTDEIWVGDLIKTNAPADWQQHFIQKFLPSHINWVYTHNNAPYHIWHFSAKRMHPVI